MRHWPSMHEAPISILRTTKKEKGLDRREKKVGRKEEGRKMERLVIEV